MNRRSAFGLLYFLGVAVSLQSMSSEDELSPLFEPCPQSYASPLERFNIPTPATHYPNEEQETNQISPHERNLAAALLLSLTDAKNRQNNHERIEYLSDEESWEEKALYYRTELRKTKVRRHKLPDQKTSRSPVTHATFVDLPGIPSSISPITNLHKNISSSFEDASESTAYFSLTPYTPGMAEQQEPFKRAASPDFDELCAKIVKAPKQKLKHSASPSFDELCKRLKNGKNSKN